jgi:hypothetical protein
LEDREPSSSISDPTLWTSWRRGKIQPSADQTLIKHCISIDQCGEIFNDKKLEKSLRNSKIKQIPNIAQKYRT